MADFLPLPKSSSRVAVVLTVVGLSLLAWGTWRQPAAFWAPGHLSRHHAAIDTCTQCHEPFVGATAKRCLLCHTATFADGAPSFSVVLHRPFLNGRRDCRECHTEHRGELAAVTVAGAQAANHPLERSGIP
jgi:hypothetical protein